MVEPLSYPGRIPSKSGLLVENTYVTLHAVEHEPADYWRIEASGEPVTLAEQLDRLNCPPMSSRYPVVAVGSNASPSQMRRKFATRGVRAIIPMTLADVKGVVPSVSAHVNKAGYIPAAPAEMPGERSRLFVLWLDDAEFEILDLTEPNYWRRIMPAESFSVTLESGVLLPQCFIYVSKHGCLLDKEGRPRRLSDQESLIGALLSESAELRKICGTTPDEFVAYVQDPSIRDAVYQLFPKEFGVAVQDGLMELPPI